MKCIILEQLQVFEPQTLTKYSFLIDIKQYFLSTITTITNYRTFFKTSFKFNKYIRTDWTIQVCL